MALLLRHLITGACLAASLSGAPATPEPTFKALLIAQTDESLGDLFYDNRGRKIPFLAGTGRLSHPYPIPSGGLVSLYRELPPATPDTPPVKLPVADIRLDPADAPWLVLMNTNYAPGGTLPQIRTQILSNSLEAHPERTIRILNFSRSPIRISVGGDENAGTPPVELASGAQQLEPYPADLQTRRIWFRAAFMKNGTWSLEIKAPQGVIQKNTRAMWVITDSRLTPERPEPSLDLRKLTEALPPPAPAPLASR
ncbi:MAG TPA: hypothetical protein VIO38_08500 [Rariglobus sp.]